MGGAVDGGYTIPGNLIMTELDWLTSNAITNMLTFHKTFSKRKLQFLSDEFHKTCTNQHYKSVVTTEPAKALGYSYEWNSLNQDQMAHLVRDVMGNPYKTPRLVGNPLKYVDKVAHRNDEFCFHNDWITKTVKDVAQLIYDTNDFKSMPILGDALEDAGCNVKTVLQHCRGLDVCYFCGGRGTVRYQDPSAHGDTDTICCWACNKDETGRGFGTPETKGWSAVEGSYHIRGCWVVDLLLGYE